MKNARNRAKREKGSAILEGALTLTVTLMMLFGIIEFGRATFAYNQVAYLAQDGARYASVRGSTSTTPATAASIQSYVQNSAVAIGSPTVTTTWQNNSNVPGNWVQVRVSYPMTFVAPYMPNSLTLAAAARLPIVQ